MAAVKTCHICQTGNLEQLEELEKVLPPGFSHLLCAKEEERAQLKVKLSTQEEVEKWLQDFQQASGWTWRKAKTYPGSGRYNMFRNDYRCQHRTYGTGPRNTNCPASLFLALKRSMEGRRSRSSDKHMVEGFLLYVNIRFDHNHPRRLAADAPTKRTKSNHPRRLGADALTKRRKSSTSTSTQRQLAEGFQGGHSPSSALDSLKEEDGEQHFFTASAMSEDEDDCKEPLPSLAGPSTIQESGTTSEERLTVLKKELDNWVDGLKTKLTHEESYLKPIQSFLQSASKLKTDSEVQAALCSYGKRTLKPTKMRARGHLKARTTIGVQPGAVVGAGSLGNCLGQQPKGDDTTANPHPRHEASPPNDIVEIVI